MFSKHILLGTLIGFILHFSLGWLIYDVALGTFFDTHAIIPMDSENMTYVALGSLLQAYALSVLFRRFSQSNFVSSGLKFGAWIGFFVGFGIGLLMYGTSKMIDIQGQLVNGFVSIVFYGIVGIGIGWACKLTAV